MNSHQIEYLFNKEDIHKKQEIWRNKQFNIFYGSGRPIYKITQDNQYERRNYDCKYYAESYKLSDLHNKNFIDIKKFKPSLTL